MDWVALRLDKSPILLGYSRCVDLHSRDLPKALLVANQHFFMQHVHGNLNWWGILKFLYYKNFGKRKIMVGLVFGVDRDYHGKGVEGAMIKWAEENIVTLNRYQETILTWIGDFNPKMIKVAENLGAEIYRKLITYRKLFDESKEFVRHPEI